MKKRVAVVTVDGEIKDLDLPISECRLKEVALGVSFNADEEKLAIDFIRRVHFGLCPLSDERICELTNGISARTRSSEDVEIAKWILDVWPIVQQHRRFM